MHYKQLTALIHKEDNLYVSYVLNWILPAKEKVLKKSRITFKEAVELFFEYASEEEVKQRYYSETYISLMEIAFG